MAASIKSCVFATEYWSCKSLFYTFWWIILKISFLQYALVIAKNFDNMLLIFINFRYRALQSFLFVVFNQNGFGWFWSILVDFRRFWLISNQPKWFWLILDDFGSIEVCLFSLSVKHFVLKSLLLMKLINWKTTKTILVVFGRFQMNQNRFGHF